MDHQPSHDFGTLAVSTTSAPEVFRVSNTGTATSASLPAVTLTGADASQFTVTNDGCLNQAVPAGNSCTVTVIASPTTLGNKVATLSVGSVSTNLLVQAVTPPALSVSVSPATFGSQLIGSNTAATATVSNSGGLPTSGITFGLVGDSDFSVVGGTCVANQAVPANGSCTIALQFTPASAGSKAGTLTVSATTGGTANASLSGIGLTPAALSFDASAYSAGTVDAGSSATVTLTLRNSGGVATGALPTLTTTGDSSFSVTGGTCAAGSSIPAAGACTIIVTFAPATYGTKNGAISVTATPGGTAATSLTGTGRQLFTLTLSKAGNGSGTYAVDGNDCAGNPCAVSFTVTTSAPTAVVTQTPAVSSVFGGWGGACTGVSGCSVTMSADRAVTATFTLKTYLVTVNLKLVRGATGTATATSVPPGPALSCVAGVCSATYNHGTVVTLSAAPSGGNLFQSWDTACTNRYQTSCATPALSSAFATTLTLRPPINYMFVTSDTMAPSTIGSDLLAADRHCDALARAAGLANTPISGTPYFKALLSTTSATTNISARDRLGTAQGWMRVDGREFANHKNDLFAVGSPTRPYQVFYPPTITEEGKPVGVNSSFTTTGSTGTGVVSGAYTCSDYTSATGTVQLGSPYSGADLWVSRQLNVGCSNQWHLYCFETQFATALTPVAPVGARLAFVTTGTIAGSAGRGPATTSGTADWLCASEASSNGLSGTFLALMAVTGSAGAPSTRFSGSAPWARRDGVLLAGSAADVLSWTNLFAPLDVTAANTYLTGFTSAWVGSTNPSTAAAGVTSDCNDWSLSSSTGLYMSAVGSLELPYSWVNTQACTASSHVLCLQQ